MNNSILKLLNQHPDKFTILQSFVGTFGSLVYRIICSSNDKFVWKYNFCGCAELLKPLEWPQKTEGFHIYRAPKVIEYFKESHMATVHISIKLLEDIESIHELRSYYQKDKNLLLKTHDIDCHTYLKNPCIRIYGSVDDLVDKNVTAYRWKASRKYIEPVTAKNVYNLCIEKLLSDDYDIFLDEYLKLCAHLDILPNINNVRAFILLQKERIKRFEEQERVKTFI